MTIGLLETGEPPDALRPRFGSYADMFKHLLGSDRDYKVFQVQAGDLPDPAGPMEGYVITGSPAGAYESLPWIPPLEDFLRRADRRTPMIGVCFGHQIMAQAFGGKVEKSLKGWGVGLHTYDIAALQPWMDGVAPIAVPASHQDQVVEPPPTARAIGGSAFTPFGMLAYDDRLAISIQTHPEFDPTYAAALIELRAERLGALARPAVQSLQSPNDCARVGGWFRRFLAQGA